MNISRSDNWYTFYCTADPATWEINESSKQEHLTAESYKTERVNVRGEDTRGRLGGGRRGDGGGSQRILDKGWEGMKEGMRMGGNKGNMHAQTEVAKQINVNGSRSNGKDKDSGGSHYTGGRNYKQGLQKGIGPSQTTLNDCWKGKEMDL